jgi:uncharacterized membrane protein
MIVPGWHPMVVHFPLALALSAAALLVIARVAGDRHGATLATVGTWNLWLGAVSALFALGTGLAAVLDLQLTPAAHQAVSLHFKWAVVSTLGLLILAAWRGAGGPADSRPSWLFVVVLCVAAAALIMTGYRGGQNVYRHGIGVTMRDSSFLPGT